MQIETSYRFISTIHSVVVPVAAEAVAAAVVVVAVVVVVVLGTSRSSSSSSKKKKVFLRHIYINRLFRPLIYKFHKTLIKLILWIYRNIFFKFKPCIYIKLTNPRWFM